MKLSETPLLDASSKKTDSDPRISPVSLSDPPTSRPQKQSTKMEHATPLPNANPNPPTFQDEFQNGVKLFEQEDYEGALRKFKSATDLGRPTAALLLKRAQTWLKLRHYHLALRDIHYLLQREPHLAEAFHMQAECQFALGNSASARASLASALALIDLPKNKSAQSQKESWQAKISSLQSPPVSPVSFLVTAEGATVPRPKKRKGINILSLDGGGVRGLSTCELLMELQRQLGPENPIQEVFDLIGGASTGGFISLALLAGLNATECRQIYLDMSKKIFDPAHRGIFPKYNASILVNFIKSTVEQRLGNPDALLDPNMAGPRVFCISTQSKTDPVKPFIHRNYEFQRGALAPFDGCTNAPIWEAARATSAAPYYFDPYEKAGVGSLMDGGLLTNNPVQVACEEAVRLFSSQPVNCIVSLGTGLQFVPTDHRGHDGSSILGKLGEFARKIPGLGSLIETLGDVASLPPMLIDIVTGSELTHELTEPLTAAMGIRYYRLNAPVPATDLDDCSDEATNALQSKSKEYIAKNQDLFKEVVDVLLNKQKEEEM